MKTAIVRCPNKKCNMEFTLTLEEFNNVVTLTKEEAQSLYHQLKNEWLNRDDYVSLQSAMKKLDV